MRPGTIVCDVLLRTGPQPHAGFQTWTLGGPGQCAITVSSKGPLIIGDADEHQCRELAEQTLAMDYRAVEGPDQTATWFSRRAGEPGITSLISRIHALSGRPIHPSGPGHSRLATPEETDIVVDWAMEFAREATPRDPPPPRTSLEHIVSETLFWLVDDEPVSMAAIVRCGRYIAGLYAPSTPESRLRRRSGCAVVERIYAEGRPMACLYTDLKNPISNRC